jgi:hypothetical protein
VAGAPVRADIVGLLATYGDRQPTHIPEDIDSLELVWLLHQIEQHYGRDMNVDDDTLSRMSTVSGVVTVLGELGVETTDA